MKRLPFEGAFFYLLVLVAEGVSEGVSEGVGVGVGLGDGVGSTQVARP